MQSAKTILLNNTLVGEVHPQPQKRRAKVEFQAYAYKLANDLNDLAHLQIYLKLAKTIERPLMEQAYSFVADSSSSEKGKLFLWKLKKIREQIDRERNKKNFKYDYVIQRQKEFKKIFANEIILKQDSEITDLIVENLKKYLMHNKKVLVLGNTSRRIFKVIENSKPKANIVELSPEINKINNSKKAKVINKDFLKNIYKDNYFDVILINNFWSQIPTESEIGFLKEIKRVAKKSSLILVLCKCNSKCDEQWKEFEYRKKIYLGYTKTFTQESLDEQLGKFDLKMNKQYLDGGYCLNVYLNTEEKV